VITLCTRGKSTAHVENSVENVKKTGFFTLFSLFEAVENSFLWSKKSLGAYNLLNLRAGGSLSRQRRGLLQREKREN